MGCPVQRQRLQASSCSRITVRKRRLQHGSATRSHFPAPPRRLKFPHRSLHGVARTKEQSQRRVRSLVLKMVFNDRPTLKDGHARISSWPGELVSNQRPYTFAQTCLLAQVFPCSPAADHTFEGVWAVATSCKANTFMLCEACSASRGVVKANKRTSDKSLGYVGFFDFEVRGWLE
jgi:hypothetical protein